MDRYQRVSSLAAGAGELGVGPAQQIFGQVDIRILEFETGGNTTAVPAEATPYAVEGNRYRNPWLGIEVEKPADFRFVRLDAFWPDPAVDESDLFIERTWTLVGDYQLEGRIRLVNLGATDVTGRIFGLMPHPEAFHHPTNHPAWTRRKAQTLRQRVLEQAAKAAMNVFFIFPPLSLPPS